jgi:hypothetical protein
MKEIPARWRASAEPLQINHPMASMSKTTTVDIKTNIMLHGLSPYCKTLRSL